VAPGHSEAAAKGGRVNRFWVAFMVGIGVGIALMVFTGCATTIPGHTIVTHHQGQTYCLYGVQLDSHYRCVDEAGPGLPPSAVHHVE
jgi:hypothetical protein